MSDAFETGPQERVTERSHTPSGIRVKKLKWEQALSTVWFSDLGGYQIDELSPKSFDAFREEHNVGDLLPTLEEAKAACQSDFQRRITECLEGEPHTVDATGWRDISTAPKDGSTVILYWGGGQVCPGSFLDNSHPDPLMSWAGWRPPSGQTWPKGQPTHWQPLPPPPGEEPLDRLQRLGQECDEESERDALQARCDKLEAAARQVVSASDAVSKVCGNTTALVHVDSAIEDQQELIEALRSVVNGGE